MADRQMQSRSQPAQNISVVRHGDPEVRRGPVGPSSSSSLLTPHLACPLLPAQLTDSHSGLPAEG